MKGSPKLKLFKPEGKNWKFEKRRKMTAKK